MSDAPSTRLRVATGYFTLTGGCTLLFGTIALVVGAVQGIAGASRWMFAAWGVLIVGTGLGALWTGRLLGERRRLGGVVAFVTLATPVVQWAVGRGPAGGVLFSLVGAAVIASVWNELE